MDLRVSTDHVRVERFGPARVQPAAEGVNNHQLPGWLPPEAAASMAGGGVDGQAAEACGT